MIERKLVKVDRNQLDEMFEGVMVSVNEIFYRSSKPGWRCRKCGWTCVTQGLPWEHLCPQEPRNDD